MTSKTHLPTTPDAITAGDMVRVKYGNIGLVSHITPAGTVMVRFVQNGSLHRYQKQSVRRATYDEVQLSWLKGVGCNQDGNLA